ncbi:MAG: hypothetical protein LBH68_00800 [Bifidobacteriaceae bacterium]|jgi:hypothetical protein|nr:hypothetical protein [Bifidobacteriaceae bacterium]
MTEPTSDLPGQPPAAPAGFQPANGLDADAAAPSHLDSSVFGPPKFTPPEPLPPLPPAAPKRGKRLIIIGAAAAVLLAVGGGFMIWKGNKGRDFCAVVTSDLTITDTVEEIEARFEQYLEAAPASIKKDIELQLAFVREEPEMNRILLDGSLSSMPKAEQEQFMTEFYVARDKYDLFGTAKRIDAEIARCPGVK